jgi:hypothetical protein
VDPEKVQLTEQKLIELMREEWDRKVLQLEKSLNAFMRTPEGEKLVVGSGTKIKHKGSGLLYTVAAVDKGRNILTLRTPDGAEFDITGEELENEYEVD